MIDNHKPDSIALSKKELIFLSSVIGAENIIGIDDPFLIHTYEDLDKEFELIKEGLENKNLIKCADNGAITMDDTIMAVVNTCCNSVSHVLIDKIGSEGSERTVFYATLHIVLMLSMPNASSEDLFFRFIPTTEAVRREILSLIPANLWDETEESMLMASLNSSDFQKFLNNNDAGSMNSVKSVLEASNVPEEKAEQAANILLKPDIKISIMSLGLDQYDQSDGNGLLIFAGADKSLLTTISEDGDVVNIYYYCRSSIDSAVDKVMEVISNTYLYANDTIRDFVSQLLSPLD